MKDNECKVYFYYLISDEIQLYGWSTKEKTAKFNSFNHIFSLNKLFYLHVQV